MDLFDDLKAVLRTTSPRWHGLTQNFSEELLRRQPLPGEWSALECLQHLIDLDRGVFPQRVRAILAGEDFPAFNPDEDGSDPTGKSPTDLANEFEALRTENLKLLDEISPDDLNQQANHSELGRVSLSELLHEWGAHDLNHTVQAERAMMQPFIAGCGPWQVFFTDHVAEPE